MKFGSVNIIIIVYYYSYDKGITTTETREVTASSLFVSVHVDLLHSSHGYDHIITAKRRSFPHFSCALSQDLNGIRVTKRQEVPPKNSQRVSSFSGVACPQIPL